MSRPALRASLIAAAVLLGQLTWIFSTPPFRGIDEFDHAYRAAGVAHGQLLPSEAPVTDGRGQYVQAPASVVEAAGPVCRSYDYTGPDNCAAVRTLDDGYVEVASGAGLYHPAFYWVVGKAAAPFEGAAYAYALRVAAALLCAALVWAAAFTLSLGRTSWPLLGAVVGMTPVFVYSTSVPGPNGVEMCAALSLWAALLALGRDVPGLRRERVLLGQAALSAAVLVTPRLLGPMWLVLVLLCVVPFLGRTRLRALVAAHRWLLAAGAGLVSLALAGALAWNRLASPNSLAAEPDLGLGDPVSGSIEQLPLWVLQSVAAFPSRNDPAPTLVYAAAFAALAAVLLVGGHRAGRGYWLAAAAVTTLWLGVQFAICLATYDQLGPVWQGRYALPFAVGIPVLLGALAERRGAARPAPVLVLAATALMATAHAASAVHVLLSEQATSPLAGSPVWWHASPAAVLAATVVAWLLTVVALRPLSGRDHVPPVAPAREKVTA